ncbi:MAG: DNA polymerase I [Acidobacteria bacterium]|nr:MAG: DNA polymerase I [Acidobacteriota bacterium]
MIQTFGTVESTLANWEKVKRKTYQASLRDHADVIRVSRELATIYCDLPIELELDRLMLSAPDRQGAFALFTELEFKTLMHEFVDTPPQEVERGQWLSGAEARAFLERLSAEPRIFLALSADQACVAGPSGPVGLIDTSEEGIASAWGALMQAESVAKVCWDSKRARLDEARRSIRMAGRVDDVMLMAFLTAPHVGDYSLRRWAMEKLHVSLPQAEPGGDGRLPLDARETAAESLSRQLDAVRRLYALLSPELDALELRSLYETIELPLVPILAEMEGTGVKIHRGILDEMSVKMERELADLTARIYAAAGCEFNINSNKQLAEVLFEKLNLPVGRKTRKTGGYSTDQAVLEELAESYEIPRLLLQYRQIAKLKSTYVDALPALIRPETGRVHTSFNQTGAATGRVSSSDPNLQNIPIRSELGRLIRRAFIAPEGHCLITADYSQVELRVLAHLSGDRVLTDAFRSRQDIHARTAEEVFGAAAAANPAEYRRRAKVINFGIVYGLSAFGLAQKLQIGREEAAAFIDAYFERYQGVRVWLDRTLDEARRTGKVRTLFGRLRPIPDIHSRDHNARSFAERTAVNSPIQGTAADIIKLAMIAVDKALKERRLSANMTLQVHDELVVESPRAESEEAQEVLRREMESAVTLDVPLLVETRVGENWNEAK